ncbi:hypothetical protein ABZ646_26425 [Streptomyces sp. NPDC007162]|uniref:hypothetical protein n=1 Tax=Streptomyces sp. NPDC007162 TaxID=3156917 RepID=UPI003411A194
MPGTTVSPRTRYREISVNGVITTDQDHATALVTADGVFAAPGPDRAGALFPNLPAP